MADAALHSSYIGRLHRLPGHVPAVGSCGNTAAGCIPDGSRGLDCGSVVVGLHLHCIPDQECCTIVVPELLPRGVPPEVRVEKK